MQASNMNSTWQAPALCMVNVCTVHDARSHWFLSHDDSDPLSVKLRSACTANHLQAGAAVVLLVASSLPRVAAPPPGALQHHQVGW